METEARQLSIIDTAVMRYSAQGGKCWWGRGRSIGLGTEKSNCEVQHCEFVNGIKGWELQECDLHLHLNQIVICFLIENIPSKVIMDALFLATSLRCFNCVTFLFFSQCKGASTIDKRPQNRCCQTTASAITTRERTQARQQVGPATPASISAFSSRPTSILRNRNRN